MVRSDLTIDTDQAAQHLSAIDTRDTRFIFAVIPEASWSPLPAGYVRHLYGTLAEMLALLNEAQTKGCAIYVTVNAMKGARRRKALVQRIRAVWAERDKPGQSLPIAPSLRIRTSQGKGHEYLISDAQDPLPITDAERINKLIADQYGGDANACDTARILRLAGSWHLKREPFRAEIIGGTGAVYSRSELLAAFPAPPPRPRPSPEARINISDRYIDSTADRLSGVLADAREHTRNATLNWCAFRLGQLGMELEPTTAHLEPIALQIGLDAEEIPKTIQSGWTAGAAKISGRAA